MPFLQASLPRRRDLPGRREKGRATKRIQIRDEPGRMQTDTRALKAAKVQALWCSLERRTSAGDGNIRYKSFTNRNKGFEKVKFRLYKPRTL
jgi:hypothetical protein